MTQDSLLEEAASLIRDASDQEHFAIEAAIIGSGDAAMNLIENSFPDLRCLIRLEDDHSYFASVYTKDGSKLYKARARTPGRAIMIALCAMMTPTAPYN